jgi:hypothetical protein
MDARSAGQRRVEARQAAVDRSKLIARAVRRGIKKRGVQAALAWQLFLRCEDGHAWMTFPDFSNEHGCAQPTCPTCGKYFETRRMLFAATDEGITCNTACKTARARVPARRPGATGPPKHDPIQVCICSCGGANHGILTVQW